MAEATIELKYGHGSIEFGYSADRFQLLEPAGIDKPPMSDAEIGAAIDAPIGSPALSDLIATGESVLLVVSDATRESGSAQIVNLLVRRLIEAGVTPADISIIFATGIHRRVTDEEKRRILTPFITQRIKTLDHDADDPAQLVIVGRTTGGEPIELNRALKEFDRIILTGAIGFHYFAGFTGGRKSICPGLASTATITATHMRALDFEGGGRRAGVGTGLLDGNAVHEECERIAELVAPTFLVNAIVDDRGRVTGVFAGDWREAHRTGCDEYAKSHTVSIPDKRDVVIASCGGSPWDINLIQAHKSLDMAAQAARDGGMIVLLAECPDGFGRSDWLKWFDVTDSRALEHQLRDNVEVNGQTAWSLLMKAERFHVCLVSSLSDDDVRRMRMTPAPSIEAALARVDANSKGYIMPRGAALLPVLGKSNM